MLLQLLMGPGGKRKKPKSLLARGAHDPAPILPTQYRGYAEGRRTHEPLPPVEEWDDMDWLNAKGGEIYKELIARAVAGTINKGDTYSTTKYVIEEGFRDTTLEEKKDIVKWMASTRSYSDMPPGAMRYQLIMGMAPIVGGFQAAQDVLRDVVNDEVSGWTAVDLASIPLEAIPFVSFITRPLKAARAAGDIANIAEVGRTGKGFRGSQRIRGNPNIPSPDDYVPPRPPVEVPRIDPPVPDTPRPAVTRPEPVVLSEQASSARSMDKKIDSTFPAKVLDNDFTRARAKNPERFDRHVVQTDNPEFADFLLRDGSMYMKANDIEMHDDILRRIGLGGLPTFQARGGVRITDGYAIELGGVKLTPEQRKVIMDLADINEAADGGMLIDAQQEGLKVMGLGGDALDGPTMNRRNVARALNDIEANDTRLLDAPPEPGQRPQGVADTLEDARAGLKTEPERGINEFNRRLAEHPRLEETDDLRRTMFVLDDGTRLGIKGEWQAHENFLMDMGSNLEEAFENGVIRTRYYAGTRTKTLGFEMHAPPTAQQRAALDAMEEVGEASGARIALEAANYDTRPGGRKLTNTRKPETERAGWLGRELNKAYPETKEIDVFAGEPEKISAAIVTDPETGRQFTAPTHAQAAEDLEAFWRGEGLDEELIKIRMAQVQRQQMGKTAYFETTGGNIVDRDEALTLANAAGQKARPRLDGRGAFAEGIDDLRAAELARKDAEIDVFAGEPQHTGGMTGGMKTESKKFMDADEARRYKPAVRWQNRAPGDDSWTTGLNHTYAGRLLMKQDVDLPFESQYGFMERGFEVTDPETGKTKFMSSEDAQADQMARRNAEDPKAKNILQRLWENESGEVRIPMPGLGGDTPARATGRGADALHRAYDETLVVTDVDRQIAEAVNAPGFQGGTWTLEGKEPPVSQRYIVSPQKETETVFFGKVTGEDVAAFKRAHQEEFSKKGYVGSWRRERDGRLVTDVSRGFTNRKDAMAVAMTGDQEAVFDRRTFGEIANPHYDKLSERTVWPDQKTAAEARNTTLNAIPHWGEASDAAMVQFMDPATRDWYLNAGEGAQRRTREAFRKSMTPEEIATVIALGEQTIGWYENAAKSLRQMFGEDAYQFGAVLAATSPQVPVASNTRYTLDLWGEWVRAGRPDDPDTIRRMIKEAKDGLNANGIDTHNVIPSSFENNVVKILSHKNPIKYFGDPKTWATPGMAMSGLKVDPFFSNVMGNLTRATIDTHVLDAFAAPALTKSRRAGMTAALNAGGAKLMDDLGLPPHVLQTAHNQEALWEPTRQIKEMVSRGELTPALFTDGELDMVKFAALGDRMKQSEDFSQILSGEEAARLLRDTGHNVDVQVPHREGLGPMGPAAQRYVQERPDELKAFLERLGLSRKLKGADAPTSDPRWILGTGGGLLGAGAGRTLREWQGQNAEQPLPPEGQQGLLSKGPFFNAGSAPAASPPGRGLFDL